MAANSNVFTNLSIGQKEKETTINTNFSLVPRFLGEFASDPATTGVATGSSYYNTTTQSIKQLATSGNWHSAAVGKRFALQATTTNTIAVRMTTPDNTNPTFTSNGIASGTLVVTCVRTDTPNTQYAAYHYNVMITSTNNTTTITASTPVIQSFGSPSLAVTINNDTANDSVNVTVQNSGAGSFKWAAMFDLIETA